MTTTEQWQTFELILSGPSTGNPYTETSLFAIFESANKKIEIRGFYDGEGVYKVRFMPNRIGEWHYVTQSNVTALDKTEGDFTVSAATADNHGPVVVSNRTSFAYADGTPYAPVGTTAYAWAVQDEATQQQTLNTLRANNFNKIRMTVFPKYYDYNTKEPQQYPYVGDMPQSTHPFTNDDWAVKQEDIRFDFSRFNPQYFQHLEQRIKDLDTLGIQADLILFHPYDHWGFARMGKHFNHLYLQYIVARLASFKNVWWSLANEYDLMDIAGQIHLGEWDDLCQTVSLEDPSDHLLSIHNFYDLPRHGFTTNNWYDYSKPWITHLSIQNFSMYRSAEWQHDYQKPVIFDECRYEGNIEMGWGDLSAEEEADNFWKAMCHGAYASHGETLIDKPHTARPIWWAHGGKLYGESYKRINYLAQLITDNDLTDLKPIGIQTANWELYAGATRDDNNVIVYFGTSQPRFERLPFLPDGKKYSAQLINTWDMTKQVFKNDIDSDTWFEMPQHKYQALLLTAKE